MIDRWRSLDVAGTTSTIWYGVNWVSASNVCCLTVGINNLLTAASRHEKTSLENIQKSWKVGLCNRREEISRSSYRQAIWECSVTDNLRKRSSGLDLLREIKHSRNEHSRWRRKRTPPAVLIFQEWKNFSLRHEKKDVFVDFGQLHWPHVKGD